MYYKIRLQWFNKENPDSEGKKFSAILDNSVYFLDKLGLSDVSEIYDGGYDVEADWL